MKCDQLMPKKIVPALIPYTVIDINKKIILGSINFNRRHWLILVELNHGGVILNL